MAGRIRARAAAELARELELAKDGALPDLLAVERGVDGRQVALLGDGRTQSASVLAQDQNIRLSMQRATPWFVGLATHGARAAQLFSRSRAHSRERARCAHTGAQQIDAQRSRLIAHSLSRLECRLPLVANRRGVSYWAWTCRTAPRAGFGRRANANSGADASSPPRTIH